MFIFANFHQISQLKSMYLALRKSLKFIIKKFKNKKT